MTDRMTIKDQSPDTPERPPLAEAIGGWRGVFDSGLPVVVFVLINSTLGLTPALWAALSTGGAIFVVRLVARQTVLQATGGFLAVALAAYLAHRSGEARNYFLPGIVYNFSLAAIFLASILVRRPVIGLIWEYFEGAGTLWRRNSALVRLYTLMTLLWFSIFLTRGVVQQLLYSENLTGWLGVARLSMGFPLYAATLALTIFIVRRHRRRLIASPAS